MASIAQSPTLDDEIDLRRYVDILVRQWKLILGTLLVCLIGAALLSYLVLPKTYTATAGVLIVRNRADLNFDPKFRTDFQTGADPTARRAAFLGLAQSTTIAADVSAKLQDRLSAEERDVNTLLRSVRATLQGDLIQIEATSGAPASAAAIANAWAEAFTAEVNTLYGESSQTATEIQAQTEAARANYETAQQQYEAFLAENRVEWLTQQVKLKLQQIDDSFATLGRLDRVIRDVQSLRERLRQGGSVSSSDAALLSVLKLNAFSAASSLPTGTQDKPETPAYQLQLAVGNQAATDQSAAQQLQEVEAILRTLETRRTELQTQAASPQPQQELARLQQANEQEQARLRTLQEQRDLARDTYNTLARKRAEVSVSSQLTDTEVRQAFAATTPERPSGPKRTLIILGAALAGLALGVLGAFILDYVRGRRAVPAL